MATRAEVLADRIGQGAEEFIAAIEGLSDEQWQTPCGSEQRSVGVLVHHVGTMYPIEADVVRMLAENGEAPGVDWPTVHGINANHATTNAAADKSAAIALVRGNVQAAVGRRARSERCATGSGGAERTGLERADDGPEFHRESPDCPSL